MAIIVSMSHTESGKTSMHGTCCTSNWSQWQEMLWHLLHHQVLYVNWSQQQNKAGCLIVLPTAVPLYKLRAPI